MTDFDLDDYILNTKKALYSAESSGQIKNTLKIFKDTIIYHIDGCANESYEQCNKIFVNLAIELLDDIDLIQKQGSQNIFHVILFYRSIDDESKQNLLNIFKKNYHSYKTYALCDAVCRYIYYEICNFNSELAKPIFETLLANTSNGENLNSLLDNLYFNLGIRIEK